MYDYILENIYLLVLCKKDRLWWKAHDSGLGKYILYKISPFYTLSFGEVRLSPLYALPSQPLSHPPTHT